MIPVRRASKARGGRVRMSFVVVCPACLFVLRGIDQVRVRTNDRLEIRRVIASWGGQAAQRPLEKAAGALPRWREGLRRSSAA
jgi:hypothetical protein